MVNDLAPKEETASLDANPQIPRINLRFQHLVHPIGLVGLIDACIAEGHDVIYIKRISNLPPQDHWIATYTVLTGDHDGLKLDETRDLSGFDLILSDCSVRGLGEVVLVLTRESTLYASEVLCLRPHGLLGSEFEKYGLFVGKNKD